jgi:hypothetical protein
MASVRAVEPVPDDKDWTWVLRRPCAECGLDAARVPRSAIAALVTANAAAWSTVLADPDGVRTRPHPQVWSPLEYACHVRDVLRLYDERLHLMLTQHDPLFANWDQDVTALAAAYGEADPETVAVELRTAADTVAASFAAVRDPAWARTGRRSDGAAFTVESFGRYFVHDPIHHLWDVTGDRAPSIFAA